MRRPPGTTWEMDQISSLLQILSSSIRYQSVARKRSGACLILSTQDQRVRNRFTVLKKTVDEQYKWE